MLDCRAQESEIAAHALWGVGRVKGYLSAVHRRINTAHTSQELQGHLNGIVLGLQAKPVAGDMSLAGAIGRYTDVHWWRRNLRTQLLRENESIEHASGTVRRREQCYVSDHAVKVKRVRAKANRQVLEGLEVVNESGQAFNLADVADASVSNPKLRRAELMVRCRGFEETAEVFGHEAVFLTITCPSRFHRFNAKGQPNEKWTGATPRDAQIYLCGVWKKIRAAWGRRGFAPYGFRVAEPHHDGCPHWHILLFAQREHCGWFVPGRYIGGRKDYGAGLLGVAGRYALSDSGAESGAGKHRFTVERINPEKGGATGYIAKYICKNIDGFKEDGEAVGLDFASGTPADQAAVRVRTWAQTWGIRQFQQIGGPSVTVYRELRRITNQIEEPLQLRLFEGAREAAEEASFMAFWLVQGGPSVRRSDLSLKPMYIKDGQGKYGDMSARVLGIQGESENGWHPLTTRTQEWTVQRAGLNDVNWAEASRLNVRGISLRAFGVPDISVFERSGKAAAPWTGVNNCTDVGELSESEALGMDLKRGEGGFLQGIHHESINSGPSGPRGFYH